jgi:hypothetical protein
MIPLPREYLIVNQATKIVEDLGKLHSQSQSGQFYDFENEEAMQRYGLPDTLINPGPRTIPYNSTLKCNVVLQVLCYTP